jgi:uncharacterized protein involved in response to NO
LPFALFNLGFRPFYLLASVYAALSIAAWMLQYTGLVPGALLRGAAWHAHEMLFGFSFAVVAGFLFTAVRNWTQQPTPTGLLLAAIVALWIAGRVLVPTPFGAAAAIVNAAFPLAVAAGIAVPLWRSGNRRNYFFVALLAGAALAAAVFHLAALGRVELPQRLGLRAALDLMLFIVAVVAGRVIPMFTNNGVPGAGATRRVWLERASLAVVLLVLAADVFGLGARGLMVLLLAAALLHGARLALWRPWRTGGNPLVWVLHLSYAWIVVHFAMRAAALAGLVPDALATHALTIGTIGGMTLGMMTRTARGHTGRPLVADRVEVACYVMVHLAAAIRVFGPLASPFAYVPAVVASGLLWSAAFALYAVRYWPVLTRPRVDGQPG